MTASEASAAPAHGRSADGLPVTISGLVHIYSREGVEVAALSGVGLTVHAGESMALIGPSGAGKSTLLSIIAGLTRPSAGLVRVGDIDLGAASARTVDRMRGGDIAVIVQDVATNLLPFLTVRENAALSVSRSRARGTAETAPSDGELLELVGVPQDCWDRPVDQVPLAVQQLTAIASAVNCSPRLILADEPTSRLIGDDAARVVDALRAINTATGATLVAVTHDEDVARALGRTVTIRDGRVGAEGRGGEELAVVAADGTIGLPAPMMSTLAPGDLVRVRESQDGWLLSKWEPADE